jgi:DNA-binding CsgD family transcriptional regulator
MKRKRDRITIEETIRRLEVAYNQSIIYAEQLNEALSERRRVEEALQDSGSALKAQASALEEVNTALNVLLRQREEDRKELEEKVLSNVKKFVLPYLETLKNTPLNAKQRACAAIIESRLNDLVSPFAKTISSKYLGLTPKEIDVAGLVREGKTTKEIAQLLNVSPRAVEFHRDNIREKLGLKNKKANLRSHLLSLD